VNEDVVVCIVSIFVFTVRASVNLAPGFSEITAPLRALLKRDNEFRWDSEVHGEAVAKIKDALSNAPVLRYYDVTKPVTIQADSSQSGLGAAILQEGHPVEFASRELTPTEQTWSQLEKERSVSL